MSNLKIEVIDDYTKCTLEKGQSFIIDIEDTSILYKYKWRMNALGYVFYGHSGLLHRLIMKPPAKEVVDHINGRPWDCRRKNMRIASQKQNSYNCRIGKNNKTGFKGVSFSASRQLYEACICVDRKTRHLGRYKTAIEAAHAYNRAASFYFGEYAKLNIIGGEVDETEVLELA
ncbi:HNH endonuclease [Clostridium sp. UBA7339]|uniref:HNH endonuclease n=1 Tax=Clostridium sp. UBA7339 TaxID=1946376 RepID=UPI00321704BC